MPYVLLYVSLAADVIVFSQVHLDALLSAADRPPGEMLTELSDLAKAHEVGYDQGKQGSLVWRLERQPEDWRGLVHGLTTRLGQVGTKVTRTHSSCGMLKLA